MTTALSFDIAIGNLQMQPHKEEVKGEREKKKKTKTKERQN